MKFTASALLYLLFLLYRFLPPHRDHRLRHVLGMRSGVVNTSLLLRRDGELLQEVSGKARLSSSFLSHPVYILGCLIE